MQSTAVYGISRGDHTIFLQRALAKKPVGLAHTPLQAGRINVAGKDVPKPGSVAADVEMAPAAAESNTKRAAAATGATQRKSPRVDPLHGWETFECGGDGACCHNSIGVANLIHQEKGKYDAVASRAKAATVGKTLRHVVYMHVKKHMASYVEAWAADPAWTTNTEDESVPTTSDEWIESLLRDERWICSTTIAAAATGLGVCIVVFKVDDDSVVNYVYGASSRSKGGFVLPLSGSHYKALLPKDGFDWLDEWFMDAADRPPLGRGAGKSVASFSPCGIPPSTPRAGKAGSIKSSAGRGKAPVARARSRAGAMRATHCRLLADLKPALLMVFPFRLRKLLVLPLQHRRQS